MKGNKKACFRYLIIFAGVFILGRVFICQYGCGNCLSGLAIFRLLWGRSTTIDYTNSVTRNKDLEQRDYPRHTKHYNDINYMKWEDKLSVMKLNQMILNNAQKQIFFKRPFKL